MQRYRAAIGYSPVLTVAVRDELKYFLSGQSARSFSPKVFKSRFYSNLFRWKIPKKCSEHVSRQKIKSFRNEICFKSGLRYGPSILDVGNLQLFRIFDLCWHFFTTISQQIFPVKVAKNAFLQPAKIKLHPNENFLQHSAHKPCEI